ncbi:MAG: hypothetical protein KJ851_00360, partial [Nanoarchaeota archaeon]|nr:hypothetical protein [Nanoarchaeota archaeon]
VRICSCEIAFTDDYVKLLSPMTNLLKLSNSYSVPAVLSTTRHSKGLVKDGKIFSREILK